MKLRELIILEAAGGGGAPAGPGGPGGPPSGDPAPSTPAASTGKIGDAPPGGGQGLSGQGTLKSAGVFIGHETPEQKHDYTAKSVVGKGIEWTKPTGSTTSEKVDKETELEMPGEHHTVGHDSEGVTEEAEASSTVSGDIATVAYPLFVRGKNNKDKRKNARAAVGQKYVPGPKGIGTGVFEGSTPINHATGVDWFDFATWALKQGDKYKDLTTNYAVYQAAKKEYKAYVKAKQQGVAEGQLDELSKDTLKSYHNKATRSEYNAVKSNQGDIADKRLAGRQAATARQQGFKAAPAPYKQQGMAEGFDEEQGYTLGTVLSFPEFIQQVSASLKKSNLNWKMTKRDDGVFLFSAPNDYNIHNMLMIAVVHNGWVSATNGVVYPGGKASMGDKQELPMTVASVSEIAQEAIQSYHSLDLSDYADELGEAHVVGNDSVIYRLDRENPMSDTEVAVLGGAGRYSLKALRDKARREAAELAQDLSVEHGGAFRRSATNIKQLTNTINTIVAAYNELARLRRKGGRGSRGITDEDANFIRECIRVVEQATQNYRLMEGLTKEPDPKGYAKDNLTSPKYTIVVNTPGDLDWYKIGTYWNNKIIDPHEFGQDDSDTVMVAQGEEEYKEMLAKINKMGLTYKTIGGTNAQPEIHDKA